MSTISCSEVHKGDIVEIRWEGSVTKRAKFVRVARTGSYVVRVERVDAKGKPVGEWGSERNLPPQDILRVLERAP